MTLWLAQLLLTAAWSADLSTAPALSLPQAVREALAGSPELKRARVVLADAGIEEPLILANLDPKFEASYTSANDRLPRASPVFHGSYAHAENWRTAISQNTLLGTQASLAWRNERVRSPSAFRVLDPSVDSRMSLELRQPLLRYFWGRPDIARRRRARAGERAALESVRHAAGELAAGAARAYLELDHARRTLAIREEAVVDARLLKKRNEEKRRYGIVEPSDLLQAEASLEAAETELEVGRMQEQQAERGLLSALHRLDENPAPPLNGPSGAPAAPEERAADRVRRALLERADLRSARARAERAEWSERMERLDNLPDLSVNATYGFGGLGTRYSDAWGDLDSLDHAEKAAGMSLSIPFGFKKERLIRRRAELAAESALLEVQKLEESIHKEVRDAGLLLELARKREAAGRRLAALEARKLAAAEEDFKRGRTTTDLLVRFQADLRRAQAALLRAEIDAAQAAVELARASGTLLSSLGFLGEAW